MADFANRTTERNLSQARLRERRRHQRWRATLAIRELRPERHVIRATSVSAGGVYCPDAVARPTGAELLLEIDLPEGRRVVVTGRVAPRRNEGVGLAIAFDRPVPELAPPARARR